MLATKLSAKLLKLCTPQQQDNEQQAVGTEEWKKAAVWLNSGLSVDARLSTFHRLILRFWEDFELLTEEHFTDYIT